MVFCVFASLRDLHTHIYCMHSTGQFYSLFCKANSSAAGPELVKSLVYLTFFDEPDSHVELNNWQYWYSQQANPNQKAFDIGQSSQCDIICLKITIILLCVFFWGENMNFFAHHKIYLKW